MWLARVAVMETIIVPSALTRDIWVKRECGWRESAVHPRFVVVCEHPWLYSCTCCIPILAYSIYTATSLSGKNPTDGIYHSHNMKQMQPVYQQRGQRKCLT